MYDAVSDTTLDRLERCPFCKGCACVGRTSMIDLLHVKQYRATIECISCHVVMPGVGRNSAEALEAAVRKWNRRDSLHEHTSA